MTPELTDDSCEACGFDSSDRSRDETITVVAADAELVDEALGSTDGESLNERPDSETWSPLEYVEHIRDVFLHSRLICQQALASPEQGIIAMTSPVVWRLRTDRSGCRSSDHAPCRVFR